MAKGPIQVKVTAVVSEGNYVYLASPYSDPNRSVMDDRFEQAALFTSQQLELGVTVYSPIVHNHPLAKYGLNRDWEFWRPHDLIMLSKASELWVLTLDGWKQSVGVSEEIEWQRRHKRPILYVGPDKLFNNRREFTDGND